METVKQTLDFLWKDELSFLSQIHAFADQTLPRHLMEYLEVTIRNMIAGALAHPAHVVIEFGLLLVVVYFLFFQRQRDLKKAVVAKSQLPNEKERRDLLAEYQSEPFGTSSDKGGTSLGHTPWVVEGYAGPYADVAIPSGGKGRAVVKRLLNYCGYDFLSLSTDSRLIELAKTTIRAYGVGSCGPRGFYGSMKPHLEIEEDLAKFLGVHSAIMYSFQFATTSTMIPCFMAKGDTILSDDGVNIVVQKGNTLSRSNVTYYRHNDMDHLEQLMKASIATDEKKKRNLFRRFVVTEGLFKNTGDLCNLPQIVALCKKYKFRLLLDDCYGFGVLGATGRGTPEYFGVAQQDIDVYSACMSTSLGAVGGFCAGSNMVVDHQRLAATGYVYSASLPPYVCKCASLALKIIEDEPERVQRLQDNATAFRSYFSKAGTLPKDIKLISENTGCSPLVHFIHKDAVGKSALKDKPECDGQFQQTVDMLGAKHGIFAARSMYNCEEVLNFPPSLRVVLKSELDTAAVTKTAKAVSAALLETFQ